MSCAPVWSGSGNRSGGYQPRGLGGQLLSLPERTLESQPAGPLERYVGLARGIMRIRAQTRQGLECDVGAGEVVQLHR